MKSTASIILLSCLMFVVGCGREASIDKVDGSTVIVAFGDSLTFGTGAARSSSYPAVLSGMLGCEVINEGVPGEVTSDGVTRVPAVLAKHNPDLVILCHGGNDLMASRKSEVVASNVETMIRAIRASGADVVLVGVPRPGLTLKPPRFYAKLAKMYGLPYEGGVLARILESPSMKSDMVHPNATGYRELAEAVARLIRQSS